MRPGALLAPKGAHVPHGDLGLGRVESKTAITTVPAVPGEWLETLAVQVKLHRTEWRVIAIVLSSPYPVSSSSVAKQLRLDYGLIKRIVRELIEWNILERVPARGLQFQPDPTRWEPPSRIVRGGNEDGEEKAREA